MKEEETTEIQSLEPLPEPAVLTQQQQRVYEALKRHSDGKWQF